MKAADFAQRLSAAHPDRKQGYVGTCPVCGRQALTFGDGKSGLTLMCYVGCDARAIVGALGLTLNDLAEPRTELLG